MRRGHPVRNKKTILVVLLGVMNGTTLLASRFSVGQYSTSNYLTVRLAIASLCYGVVVWMNRKKGESIFPTSLHFWFGSILVGLLTAFSMNTIIMAMNYISSGLNSVLLAFGPAVTVLFAHFLLTDERLTLGKIFGIILALLGVVLVVLSGESGLPEIEEANSLGYILSISGITVSGFSSVYVRKHLADFDTVHVATVRNLVALVVSTLLSFFVFGFDFSGVNPMGYAVLLYAALIGTFASHLLNVHINQKYGATIVSMTTYIIPIVSILGGAILLDEVITVRTLLGMALIIIGVLAVNDVIRLKKKAEETP